MSNPDILADKKNGYLSLLVWINRGETRKTICQLLGITNQVLGRKFQKLEANGYIKAVQRRPVSIFKLTDNGKQLITNLIASDHMYLEGFFKCHHQIIGFRIKDFGNWKFNQKIWKTMKGGWHYEKGILDGIHFRIQEPTKNRPEGLLAVICPQSYSKNPSREFERQKDDATKISTYLALKYGMSFRDPYRVREGHKELVGSEAIADKIGYIKIGKFWVDASGLGGKKLEESQDTNTIERMMEAPDRLDRMERLLERFTEQLALHLEVEQKQSNNQTLMTETLIKLTKAIEELKDLKK